MPEDEYDEAEYEEYDEESLGEAIAEAVAKYPEVAAFADLFVGDSREDVEATAAAIAERVAVWVQREPEPEPLQAALAQRAKDGPEKAFQTWLQKKGFSAKGRTSADWA